MSINDLLNAELTENNIRILVNSVYQIVIENATSRSDQLARSKTLGPAKTLVEFYDLVRQVIEDYELRKKVPTIEKIRYTEEEPDVNAMTETIAYSLISREPGAFQRGAPLEATVKNLRPRLREEMEDADHPGYRLAILGYWYDNVVRFTCWATTNKVANARAKWFEDVMEEYSWFFKIQGIDRVLYHGQKADIVINNKGNKWYGRPIDYFVRNEKIRVFSEKTIESIIINIMTKND